MDLGLQGRLAAVAASTAGLGFETARALAAEGARVAICGRDRQRVDEALERLGGNHVGFVTDVGNADGGARFVQEAIDALGTVDIVVANAGGPPPGTFESTDIDRYAPALDLNLLSVVGMAKAAIPVMQRNRFGRFIAITSVSVRQPIPNLILSNTARAGVTGFLKTVAREVYESGVTVNTVQPGLHATNRVRSLYGDNAPGGSIGDPADFGAVVAFLCSEQAKFITGANLQVDGGAYSGLL